MVVGEDRLFLGLVKDWVDMWMEHILQERKEPLGLLGQQGMRSLILLDHPKQLSSGKQIT